MKPNPLCRWLAVIAVASLLSACTWNQSTSMPQPTNTAAPTLTATRHPTNTLVPTSMPTPTFTPLPTPITFDSAVYEGWPKYTNARYQFTLRHPPDWTRREIQGSQNTMSGHAVYLEPRAPSLVRLVVGFKRATEDAQITRTGVGSGEIIRRGSIAFLGQPISRDVLVLDGNDLAILYQGSGEIRRGDLVFTLSLDYRGNPTDKLALTQTMETQADRIIASFQFVS